MLTSGPLLNHESFPKARTMTSSPARFGLSCALTTPMTADGSVDLRRLADHAVWVLSQGCDGVTLYGTTGEGAALGFAERQTMMEALTGAGIEPSRIHAGVAAAALPDAIVQGRVALDAGAKGLLVAPPFYFKNVGDDGLFVWFSQFIEGLGPDARGIILYHIPSVTAVEISVDLVQRLKMAFPGVIAGIKDSSGSAASTEAFLAAHGELAILVGDERQLARAVRNGAQGSICGVANIVPHLLRPMVHEGVDSPEVCALVDEICSHPVVPAVKALAGHVRGDAAFGPMRAPLVALDEVGRSRLFAAFDRITRARAA